MNLVTTIIVLVSAFLAITSGCSLPSLKLKEPRTFANAFTIGNKAIIAGGFDRTGAASFLIDIFDLCRNRTSTSTLKLGRSRFASAVLSNRAFVAGGCLDLFCSNVTSTVEIYDEDMNYLTTATLSEARGCLSSAVTATRIFFFGGCTGITTMSSTVDIYDSESDMWTSHQLPFARSDGAAVTLNNLVMFGGGWSNISLAATNRVDIFETQTNEWTTLNLTEPRYGLAASATNNIALFAGGSNLETKTSTIDIYDNLRSRWSTTNLLESKSWLSSATLGGKNYFAGGWMSAFNKSDLIEIYDTISTQWTARRLSKGRYGIASTSASGKVFFAGGQTDGNWDDFQYISDIVDVLSPPVITSQLSDIHCYYPETKNITIKLKATGQGLHFQWLRNGQLVNTTQTTNSALVLQNIALQDNGTVFQAIVTDQCGDSVTSLQAYLRLHSAPTIHAPSVYAHQTLNITIDGFAKYYVWFLNGLQINNTKSFYLMENVDVTLNNTNITVKAIIDNDAAWLVAPLTIWGPPHIQFGLSETLVIIGQHANFTVDFTGQNVIIEWLVDNNIQMKPMDSPAYQFQYLPDPKNFTNKVNRTLCVRLTNPAGIDSSCAIVRIVNDFDVFQGPYSTVDSGGIILEGRTILLTIDIEELNCIDHYWTHNDVEIPGTRVINRSGEYIIESLNDTSKGSYEVRAICYGRPTRSKAITFNSLFYIWYIALIVIGGLIAIGVVTTIFFLVKKRFQRDESNRNELQTMMQKANLYPYAWHVPQHNRFIGKDQLPFDYVITRPWTEEIVNDNGSKIVNDNGSKKFILEFDIIQERRVHELLLPPDLGTIYTPLSPTNFEMTINTNIIQGNGERITIQVELMLKVSTLVELLLLVDLYHDTYTYVSLPIVSNSSSRDIDYNAIEWIKNENVVYEGEYSTVRKAKLKFIGGTFAVKQYIDGPEAEDLWRRETEILNTLHSNQSSCHIVKFIGSGPKFIITELATESNLLKNLKMVYNIDIKVEILLQVAEAILYLHKNGIVHCDIKAANILVFKLSSEVIVRLSDFNAARRITETIDPVGGIYMAPELSDDHRIIEQDNGYAVDIFSFGILMCVVIKGDEPTHRFSPQQIQLLDCDPEIKEIIEACCTQEPSKRLHITDIVHKLRNILSRLPKNDSSFGSKVGAIHLRNNNNNNNNGDNYEDAPISPGSISNIELTAMTEAHWPQNNALDYGLAQSISLRSNTK